MGLTINTNTPLLNIHRNLTKTQASINTALQRISTGKKLNSARDDPGGLGVSERIDSQVRGMRVAMENANDGVLFAKAAENGLNEITSMLQRMRELAIQNANNSFSTADRNNINLEFSALDAEIGRIAQVTQFNGLKILSTNAGTFNFQVGANVDEKLGITTPAILPTGVNIANSADISDAINTIDLTIENTTAWRAAIGASESRFSIAINNLQMRIEGQEAAHRRIIDADFAVETANLVRSQILQDASTAMAALANSRGRGVLSLLG